MLDASTTGAFMKITRITAIVAISSAGFLTACGTPMPQASTPVNTSGQPVYTSGQPAYATYGYINLKFLPISSKKMPLFRLFPQ